MGMVTPIFRMFDVEKAKEFYLGYLGFRLDWEARFEPDFPLYMQVSLGSLVVHLSEHYGDGSPGAAIRVETNGLDEFHRALTAKNYRYLRPGIEETEWNTRELRLLDPFGNRIVFFEASGTEEA
ncbi:glyoxalase superfamily protein [Cohnella fermenti]|uniref:Bleomycin resistance protein n=1 Tax=Cohnella fermenti TaxID=2565925 RepID=A0A4V3WDS2_9BACL|nr:glyoxalase superfamily protein [Cohnella fermenti]THF73374.1 VOC family protein [Cohnella fermenti]